MISIVILAHNKARYTDVCLRSVLASKPADFEILVGDNGSTDETPRVLEHLSQVAAGRKIPFHVIRNEAGIGCATARNEAVARASGEELVFLDNDTVIPDPAWLEKLKRILHSDEKAAIVGPKLCYPFEPHLIQCAGVGISRTGRVQFRGRGEDGNHPRYGRVEEVQALISACFMFRRTLYDGIGGLDEAFNPIQYEDFDFCYRARSRGLRCVYTPDPVVYHWESVTSDGTAALPNRYVIIKHGMLFKRRWRHMFEKEDGPPDDETQWRVIEMPSLEGPRRR